MLSTSAILSKPPLAASGGSSVVGSICNPSAEVRKVALDHLLESVEIAKALKSRDLSLWVSDGSNYPGTQSIRKRIDWMIESLC